MFFIVASLVVAVALGIDDDVAAAATASAPGEPLTAHVKWAQRRNKLLLTIVENNIEQESVNVTRRGVQASFLADDQMHAGRKVRYVVDLEFYKRVVFENATWDKSMWNIKFQIPKERTEKYWPRLLKSKQRPPSLVVDWPNWIEDTDDDDGGVSKLAYDDDDRDDTAAPAKKAAPKPPADAVPGAGLASSVAGETASSKPKTKAPPVAAKPKGRGGDDDDEEDEAEPAVRLPPPLHFDL